MIEIVNPTLDDYMARVRHLASYYLGDADQWYNLPSANIDNEDHRDEFSFIRMALWDKLMEREFFPFSSPPGEVTLFNQCGTQEPGATIPGSSILDGDDWALIATQRLSAATSIAASF
jgi:hypothetical protein